MRIAILTQYFPPEMGAPQNRLYELAQELSKTEKVLVLTAMPNYPAGKILEGYRRKLFCVENLDALRVERFPIWPSNSKRAIPRIISMLSFSVSVLFSLPRLLFWRPDFLFVESPPLLLGLSGYILSFFTRAKFVLNISDIWPLGAAELGVISKESPIYKTLEKLEHFLYRKSDLAFGQSSQIVEHLRNSGATRAHLFRNGVDIKRFTNPRQETAHKEQLRLRILYAGLLGVAQGVLGICREINFSDLGAELHIYGDGPERIELEKFVSESPNRGIFLNAPIPRKLIPEKIPQFDCALVPLTKSLFGAVPSKIYEAMAAGLPILFSGAGEGASIIQSHNAGWISPPSDYERLAENIRRARENPSERSLFGRNARQSAETHFDRQIQIGNLREVLSSGASV